METDLANTCRRIYMPEAPTAPPNFDTNFKLSKHDPVMFEHYCQTRGTKNLRGSSLRFGGILGIIGHCY